MTMDIGIVGLPNVGKSTLFNALTHAQAVVASYPFTTIEPNVGVVTVDDPRVVEIAKIIGPDEVIPTTVRFVDIAGLVKGASHGEGLGNQFLGNIRNVDAIAMVVRCFADDSVPHVSETLQPLDDLSVIDTELLLADLATVDRRLEKVQTSARIDPKTHAEELAWLEGLHAHVAEGSLASEYASDGHDGGDSLDSHDSQWHEWSRELNLLTAKPRMILLNVGEDDLPDGGALAQGVASRLSDGGAPAVVVCAQLEAALADWPAEESRVYRDELGVDASGLSQVVETGYRLLDLLTFFTTTGGKIVQAWTVSCGATAPQAAGKIHTDIERGFIRAEVVKYDDLVAQGSMASVREHGLLHLEGKEYVVRDGDVIHFRFAV